MSYRVPVRNEETRDVIVITITEEGRALTAQEAQESALIRAFRDRGWRKAVALQPEEMRASDAA